MRIMLALLGVIAVAGCTVKDIKTPPAIGMANPAARYCVEQGGILTSATAEQGQFSYCTLPSGERIEAWALYRRSHPQA
ncbi:DUF333 domain-containing protein [Edwardsiella piscicida]|uniref:DUF333 domain-containing protein n=2 Tax=Edwardsiella piscicida TaxID=1263550 RepID=A0AAQ3H4P5_EDWPI|nr:DUF333 domain-containing protein [Edwardsiella piscicida]ARD17125.1 hypothetical protein BXA22_01530 [Edwardsiella piscicida]ELM3659412.1 DUF333 domain-containing protein [Edwardsiella piscicida]ELM3737059.1 DUF333 domain-containing protein [Edwardsiella piscicida]MDM3865650.1 DUF333 domain-containing protein [Edwardsiella piscicida]QBB11215.1 DUF333 domain-containing protein [Edwardsiella piscicida]